MKRKYSPIGTGSKTVSSGIMGKTVSTGISIISGKIGRSFYWDATNGNDSNPGTQTLPYKTFGGTNPAAVLAAPRQFDSYYISGIIRPDFTSSTTFNGFTNFLVQNVNNITISGMSTTLGANGMAHDAPIGGTWVLGAGVYTQTIGTGYNIATITVNYTNSGLDMLGNSTYTGILRSVSLVNVATTTNSWNYNSATGVITINSSLDPNSTIVTAGLSTTNIAMALTNCNNCVVKNLDFSLIGFGGVNCYQFGGTTCINTLVTNCRFRYGAYHSCGFIGTTNSGNIIVNCYFYGSTYITATQTVHFCAAGSGNNVTGARITGCYFSVHGPIDPANVLHANYAGITANYCHTAVGAGGPRVSDFEGSNNTYSGYLDSASTWGGCIAMSGGDALAVPSTGTNEKVWSNYNIRYSDCTSFGLPISVAVNNDGTLTYPNAIGFRRVSFKTGNLVSPSAGVWIGFTTGGNVGANKSSGTVLFESCDIEFNLKAAGTYPSYMGCLSDNTGKRYVCRDNTFRDLTVASRDGNVFEINHNGTLSDGFAGVFVMEGNIYERKNNRNLTMFACNSAETNAVLQTLILTPAYNWWYTVGGSFSYCGNTAASPKAVTQAEFTANIDTTSTYDSQGIPQFADDTVSGLPLAGGNITILVNGVLTPTPGNGINGSPYNRTAGAYQLPL